MPLGPHASLIYWFTWLTGGALIVLAIWQLR